MMHVCMGRPCASCASLSAEIGRLRGIEAKAGNAKLIEGIIRGVRLRGGTIDDVARALSAYLLKKEG